MKPRIIINADDFGMSEAVNRAIIGLISTGSISSTTLMMNGPVIEEALEFARTCSTASFGVHLNITQFAPLHSRTRESKFCTPTGELSTQFHKQVGYWDHALIAEEWGAQIERCLEAGIDVSHLDSHHHVHTKPEVFLALKKVMSRYKINKVRITRNLFPESDEIKSTSVLTRFKKAAWSVGFHQLPPRPRRVDIFGSVNDFVTIYDQRKSNQNTQTNTFEREFGGKTLELMCHPGAIEPHFVKEYLILNNGLGKYIGMEYDLITYHDI